MWSRVVEFMLGCWLAVSPFIFQHGDAIELWLFDFATATLVVSLALISYWAPMRHAHLAIAAVAAVMIGFGRLADGWEPGPAYQNHIVVGLLLMMFAIVPNRAETPPASWYRG